MLLEPNQLKELYDFLKKKDNTHYYAHQLLKVICARIENNSKYINYLATNVLEEKIINWNDYVNKSIELFGYNKPYLWNEYNKEQLKLYNDFFNNNDFIKELLDNILSDRKIKLKNVFNLIVLNDYLFLTEENKNLFIEIMDNISQEECEPADSYYVYGIIEKISQFSIEKKYLLNFVEKILLKNPNLDINKCQPSKINLDDLKTVLPNHLFKKMTERHISKIEKKSQVIYFKINYVEDNDYSTKLSFKLNELKEIFDKMFEKDEDYEELNIICSLNENQVFAVFSQQADINYYRYVLDECLEFVSQHYHQKNIKPILENLIDKAKLEYHLEKKEISDQHQPKI